MRRTKIIATLGPSTDREGVLESMLAAGLDAVRLNFSHGDADEQVARAEAVRAIASKLGRPVGIIADLPGTKIRLASFAATKVVIESGSQFIIDPDIDPDAGDERGVGVNYPELAYQLSEGDILLLDDGRLSLEVEKKEGQRVYCRVAEGGEISSQKGVNRLGGGLSMPQKEEKTREVMKLAVKVGADFVAISFPVSAEDIDRARNSLSELGFSGLIIAKIEKVEALANLEDIIHASDIIMIARGDLGVEIGDARLPAIQKKIIKRSRQMNRVVITATQMMESMINEPVPTRAEVFDVANAVLDGTDAVMLSAESAIGKYPLRTAKRMMEICLEAEKHRTVRVSGHRLDVFFEDIEETVAMSVMYAANHLQVRAIASLTETGQTPKLMSRISSGIPIYGLSRHLATLRRMTLYRGVYPLAIELISDGPSGQHNRAIALLVEKGLVTGGDFVISSCGETYGKSGSTNSMKIMQID